MGVDAGRLDVTGVRCDDTKTNGHFRIHRPGGAYSRYR